LVAFRTVRDAWFICFCAAGWIADSLADAPAPDHGESWRELAMVAAAVTLLLLFAAPATSLRAALIAPLAGIIP
jgi:hypothetical protein